eukprot:TRINITY_DN2456_c0_g1_i1.p1 TRINITY_DN2456_c0_g1~~TRINITY_DN2456_c0_g1_i1.p1  ORF type:complete len:642 (+),score=220.24 TRINITY_DN2456_c0_g1_i1:197-1927(+)
MDSKSKLSYLKGESNPPLKYETIGKMFEEICNENSSSLALISKQQQIRWNWKEFESKVDSFAFKLMEMGYKRGDRLGVWMPNNVEWLVAAFASFKIGVILVNVNPAYRTHELEHALKLTETKGLIFTPTFKNSNYVNMIRELIPESNHSDSNHLKSDRFPFLKNLIQVSDKEEKGFMNSDYFMNAKLDNSHKKDLKSVTSKLDTHDVVNIQFTSGTTGLPKGAALTHHNILNNGFGTGEIMGLTNKDKMCIPVPFYHCFGIVLGCMAGITHGSTIVIPGAGFDPTASLQTVSEEKCTVLHGVPTMFIAMLNHPQFSSFDLSHLRTGIMAGSPCPKEVMKKVESNMNMKEVTIAYGMTETSPLSFQTRRESPLDKRTETVGTVMPHTEVKLVDSNGETVPVGSAGELWVKGYQVMKGYWRDDKKTAESIKDGWMATGDLGVFDEEGYCSIVGRIKDVIIRGGENIYPREVEEFLYKHPKIEDVQLVGVPDEKFVEQTCAWIIPKKGETLTKEEIQSFCKDKIAHYKVPHYMLFVKEFPLTITGKVQKYLMRDESIKILGLKQDPTWINKGLGEKKAK